MVRVLKTANRVRAAAFSAALSVQRRKKVANGIGSVGLKKVMINYDGARFSWWRRSFLCHRIDSVVVEFQVRDKSRYPLNGENF